MNSFAGKVGILLYMVSVITLAITFAGRGGYWDLPGLIIWSVWCVVIIGAFALLGFKTIFEKIENLKKDLKEIKETIDSKNL